MTHSYHIIDSFSSDSLRISVAEKQFAMTEDHMAIQHEYHLQFGSHPISLSHEEMMAFGGLMVEALELAKKRTEEFYREVPAVL